MMPLLPILSKYLLIPKIPGSRPQKRTENQQQRPCQKKTQRRALDLRDNWPTSMSPFVKATGLVVHDFLIPYHRASDQQSTAPPGKISKKQNAKHLANAQRGYNNKTQRHRGGGEAPDSDKMYCSSCLQPILYFRTSSQPAR